MTTFKDYPYWAAATLKDTIDQVQQICHIRKDDITQIQNLPNVFLQGRKVGKIPTTSADVSPADKINDFNWTAGFLYILIDNSGTPVWRRTALGAF